MAQIVFDADLATLLEPVGRKGILRYRVDPHPLKAFFRERSISQSKLARVLGCHQPDLSKMLSNQAIMPPDVEEKLYTLQRKVIDWEQKNKRIFGS
jgi:hypothetical protein